MGSSGVFLVEIISKLESCAHLAPPRRRRLPEFRPRSQKTLPGDWPEGKHGDLSGIHTRWGPQTWCECWFIDPMNANITISSAIDHSNSIYIAIYIYIIYHLLCWFIYIVILISSAINHSKASSLRQLSCLGAPPCRRACHKNQSNGINYSY